MMTTHNDLTELLQAWVHGDKKALECLMPLVYQELKKLAGACLRDERRHHTLQPTALVHEAFLKLDEQKRVNWNNRCHFFAIAAQAMRRILVDKARRRRAAKRQAQTMAVSIDDGHLQISAPVNLDIERLDAALIDLHKLDGRQSQIVELRYFGGLTIAETATVLGVSPATVKLDWTMAKSWLFNQLYRGSPCRKISVGKG